MSYADLLLQRKTKILKEWEKRVRESNPNIKYEKAISLMDSMPIVIDVFAEILSYKVPADALNEKASSLSIAHGRERAELQSYTIEELIKEYHIFREVLFDQLEADQEALPTKERNLLLRAIEISVRNAIRQFIDGRKEFELLQNRQMAEKTEKVSMLSQRFDLLINEIEDMAIFGIDANGLLSTWNKGVLRISGYSEHEFVGKPYRLLFSDEENSEGIAEKELATALELGVLRKDSWRRRKNGTLYWGSMILTPIKNSAGDFVGYIEIIKDSTDQKKLEDQLRMSKNFAEEASAAKSAFLAGVSHEIRTPLGIILGYAGMVEQNAESAEIAKYGGVIRRSGESLLGLVDDLLDLSKAESGKIDTRIGKIETVPFIQDVIAFLSIKAREKKIRLGVALCEPLPKYVWSDKNRLRQILINVIGNAIKFTPSGAVTVEPYCESSLEGRFSIIFRVIDTGIGIAKNKSEEIFHPFVQGEKYITRQFGGSGLGLAIGRRIARELGGDVVLKSSKEDHGSVFEVTVNAGDLSQVDWIDTKELRRLAAQLDIPALDSVGVNQKRQPKNSLEGINVLVVEDVEENQTLIKLFLQRAGAVVDVASDGFEGVSKARTGNFDAVLMDIQMPAKNGYEATAELRNFGFDRPIIALTAHAMKGVRESTLSSGFDDFITKPIDSANLMRVVARNVKRYQFKQPKGSDGEADRSLSH